MVNTTPHELSIFIDESGDIGTESKYYLLTLVFHDQADELAETFDRHQLELAQAHINDIPLHLNPLMRANDSYAGMSIQDRKRYLAKFAVLAQHIPYRYHSFVYEKRHFCESGSNTLANRMRRDLVAFLFDHFDYFEAFGIVKIYYDNGQEIVTASVHDAIQYVLAQDAVVYRDAPPANYRLSQLADYVCGIELAALKYARREQTATDRTFFGESQSFKKNWLKKVRRHLL